MELEFKFRRPLVKGREESLEYIRIAYEDIIRRYFKEVFQINEVDLIFKNLNYVNENNFFLKLSEVEWNSKPSKIKEILSNTDNIKVECFDRSLYKNLLFYFYMYDQNNCCGALACSDTYVQSPYRDHSLGKILQYIKEDIAIENKASRMYCTDTYHKIYKGITPLKDLKPYLPNTKLLLNSGWKIIDMFFNRKSNNVVGMYLKDIPTSNENNIDIIMKITPVKEKLIQIKNVSVGCDPELFLRNKESKQFIPSFYVMKGDKYAPVAITEKGHNIQCDNVMVEYGVPPSTTAEEFVENNLLVQNYLKDKVAEPNGLELVIFPSANFEEAHLVAGKAKEFGCDPDYNVWEEGKPNTVGNSTDGLRTAGGHIHVGYSDHNRVTSNYIIKALDLFVSVPLVKMEPNNRRKEMYGKAGAFRPQPWGVEYRVTSNYIYSSPELMTWAFNQVQKAIKFINDGKGTLLDAHADRIIEAINEKNMSSVRYLAEKFNLEIMETVKVK